MKKDDAIKQLKQLSDEAHRLADEGAVPGEERFDGWREKTKAALDAIYRANSSERRQFEAIRFELDPTLLDLAKRLLPRRLANHGFDVSKVEIDLKHKRHCAKRLGDAAELLLSFVVGLRQCN
jgi:hypothetical protein